MRDIVVTPQVKQIILFDHYDKTFWNGILEEFKIDLINGNFFESHTDRVNWFYHATVVNGYHERPKLLSISYK